MYENEISKEILNSAFKVHSALGPGLLESSYKECLYYEIKKSGLFVEKEKPLPLIYENVKLEIGYRIDLLVENKVIIEVKSVEGFNRPVQTTASAGMAAGLTLTEEIYVKPGEMMVKADLNAARS